MPRRNDGRPRSLVAPLFPEPRIYVAIGLKRGVEIARIASTTLAAHHRAVFDLMTEFDEVREEQR